MSSKIVTGVRVRIDGQLVRAQLVSGEQLGPKVHRNPGRAVRQRRDPVQGQAPDPDTSRGARHVLRPVAGHDRQLDFVQGVQPRVPHNVLVDRPHPVDRVELRLFGSRPAAVVAHRPTHFRPGEHPAVGPRQPVEELPETETQTGPGPPAPRQVAHIATVLFRAHHQRRGVRPVQILVPAKSRADSGHGAARRPVIGQRDIKARGKVPGDAGSGSGARHNIYL